MTRLESLAMQLEANNIKTTAKTTTTTTTTATHTADRPQPKIHTDRNTISTTESNNNNNNKTIENPMKADDDKHKQEQAWETKRQHKQGIEKEQAWYQNNNKQMRSKASKREAEKEKERETARRRCETARLELARQLPQKEQQVALKQKIHQLQLLKLWETQQQQVQQL